MMRSLSVERMYLSDDPDDWVWWRWQWARPGAQPLDKFHAFGFNLWESDFEERFRGVGIALRGGVYARETTSLLPGTDSRGTDEQWRDGLAGVPLPDGPVVQTCAGEWWGSDVCVAPCVGDQAPAADAASVCIHTCVGGSFGP